MKRITLYVSEDIVHLLNHIYALRIIDGKKATKSNVVSEAIVLLAEKEKMMK